MLQRGHMPRHEELARFRDAGWHDVFHILFWLAMIGLIVLLAIWLITSMRREAQVRPGAVTGPPAWGAPARADGALEEARMRYARGEIPRDDYRRMVVDLGGPPLPPDEASPG